MADFTNCHIVWPSSQGQFHGAVIHKKRIIISLSPLVWELAYSTYHKYPYGEEFIQKCTSMATLNAYPISIYANILLSNLKINKMNA